MTIKEEPTKLEFNYEDDEDSSMNCKISYEEGKVALFFVSEPDSAYVYPLNFFVEIVDFLKKKGIVKDQSGAIIGGPVSPVNPSGGTIAFPQVVKKDGTTPAPAEPFTSLSSQDTQKEKDTEEDSAPEPQGKVVTADQSASPNIIKRPVIKSRITDENDPLAVEREARLLRGETGEKSIKSKHR